MGEHPDGHGKEGERVTILEEAEKRQKALAFAAEIGRKYGNAARGPDSGLLDADVPNRNPGRHAGTVTRDGNPDAEGVRNGV